MKENFPLVSYERDMNHNYMVLYQCDFFEKSKNNGCDYRMKMLLQNKIKGLLPITHRQINGENKYYYEINSLQPLDRLIEKHELKYGDLRTVLLGCIHLFERLEEYLLSGEQIIIKPEFIYVNVENMEPNFVCYPDYTSNVRLSFMEFIDILLAHIDHTDEDAVMLGYQAYRYTRNPNYVLNEIKKYFIPKNDVVKGSDEIENSEIHNKNPDSFVLVNNEYKTYDSNDDDSDYVEYKNKGDIKELIGGIFCVFVALCAGAVIFGARILHYYQLSGDNELYMYGAVAMALVAAVLFFMCYVKTVRQNREIAMLNEENEESVYEELIQRDVVHNLTNERKKEMPHAMNYSEKSVMYSNNTVCLGNEAIEERVLRGRINGKEISIALDCLPLTIGKLGGVSDFIINDNAVSKMHARFEEHEGKVCVCDLNSTNGTVHNGELIAIQTPVALVPGDTLRFGRSCFTYY